MKNASFNYVRAFRRRQALTEDELARLLGLRGHSAISRFESGDRFPTLGQGLGLQILFGMPADRLFPGLFEEVEESVMRQAAHLIHELEGRTDVRSVHKREFLEGLPSGSNRDEV